MSVAEQVECSPTGARPGNRSGKPRYELSPWPIAVRMKPATGTSGPERDLERMAQSVSLHSSQIYSTETLAFRGQGLSGEAVRDRFLSMKDRQYIRALVIMGYREEAARLVNQAYARRKQEREAARAQEEQRPGRATLFTRFDIDYLEMLILVGDRRAAMDLFLRTMDDYERDRLGTIVRRVDSELKLEMEYRETIRAIEAGQLVAGNARPGKVQSQPKAPSRSLLRRLLGLKPTVGPLGKGGWEAGGSGLP